MPAASQGSGDAGEVPRSDRPAVSGAAPRARRGTRRRSARGQGFFLWLSKYYAFGFLVIVAHLVAGLAILYASRSRQVPPTPSPRAAAASAEALTRFYAGDGRLIGEIATEWRRWVAYDRIPPLLAKAFVAVEDHRFYQHHGIDWSGLARAAWTNLRTGRVVQGGSTITQQVAKTYIGSERTVDRKIREAILATRMEAVLSKSQILELYLNRIFLGNGAYGVVAAARRYFDKRLDELSLPEMALIAGLAQAPTRYNPFGRPWLALERRNVVLGRMREAGYINETQYRAAVRAGLPKGATWGKGGHHVSTPDLGLRRRQDFFHGETPYFTEHVRQLLEKRFGKEALLRGGLRVETTVDTAAQAAARRNVDEMARWVDKRQGWRGPVAWLPDDPARARFRKAARAAYGSRPLEPGRRYLGLVERVTTKAARVRVSDRAYTLPLRFLRWGARFYSRSAVNDRFVSHAWLVLIPGDVVWVRLAPKGIYDPLLPGSDGGPGVRSGHYAPPPVHLRDGRPGRRVKPLNLPRGSDWPGPPYIALEQTPRVQGALYAYDLHSGYVQVMVGGTDFDRSSFNRVTQACRQPGSAYKPIYYSLAMDRGFSFYTKLKDKPYSIVDPETGKVWYATDYQHDPELMRRFGAHIRGYTKTLEQALVWSKNKASLDLFCKLGPKHLGPRARCRAAAKDVAAWARRLGFTTEIIPDEALGLGASCTRTEELSRAFAAFAMGGKRVDSVAIRRVIDRHGRVLLDHTVAWDPMLSPADRLDRLYARAGVRRPQMIPPRAAYRTATLLRKVVTEGHGEVVRMTRIPAAGKTGTASRTADTWFVGFTSRWLATAWLGDDHYVRSLGRYDASFTTALPMWARFFYDVARHQPLREIPWLDDHGRPLKRTPVVPATLPHTHKPDLQPPFKRHSVARAGAHSGTGAHSGARAGAPAGSHAGGHP